MHFPTILGFAILATSVAACKDDNIFCAPGMAPPEKRSLGLTKAARGAIVARDSCGSYYDDYLGPGQASTIQGNGHCHNIKGEAAQSPNSGSTFTLKIKGQCNHCDFYTNEGWRQVSYGVGHSQGTDWEIHENWGRIKSFKC